MNREFVVVWCDVCVAPHLATPDKPEDDEALLRLAFRHNKRQKYPTFFISHSAAHRAVSALGWYDDATTTLCPEHFAAHVRAVNAGGEP
jgi:hypothetical protein